MLTTFRHRGLGRLFREDDGRRLPPHLLPKLKRILFALDKARSPREMRLPGFRLHALTGRLAGFWSVSVSANWRVIFRFVHEDAVDVDFVDYH